MWPISLASLFYDLRTQDTHISLKNSSAPLDLMVRLMANSKLMFAELPVSLDILRFFIELSVLRFFLSVMYNRV